MRFYLCGVILILVAILAGCVESSFNLAPDSRLPEWFDVPEGMTRNDLSVTMDYYVKRSGGQAVFKLYNKHGKKLEQVTGHTRGDKPIKLKNSPAGFPPGRPMYEVVTVNGIVDIIEHREKGPTFYVTSDPTIWKELGVRKEE
ncbi:MAG: hypothetical protein ABFS24_03450 [Pseudomonadota bacterium]